MKPELPPTGLYRAGQDFQSQRARNRAKGVESARYEDGCCGGPRPADVWDGATRSLKGEVKSAKITQQPSNQDAYGANREAIRKIKPFGRSVG